MVETVGNLRSFLALMQQNDWFVCLSGWAILKQMIGSLGRWVRPLATLMIPVHQSVFVDDRWLPYLMGILPMEGYFRGIPGFLKSTHRLLGRNVDPSRSALCLPKQVSGISLLISRVLFVPVLLQISSSQEQDNNVGYHCHIFHVVRGQIAKGD